jgi:ribosomal protein S18 acetylase RimI-like enzyme
MKGDIRLTMAEAEVDGVKSVLIVALETGPAMCLLVGSVEVRFDGLFAEMRRLVVGRAWRRQGIGTMLYEGAVEAAKRAGRAGMTWAVRKNNYEALLFYRQMEADLVHDDGEDFWMNVRWDGLDVSKVLAAMGRRDEMRSEAVKEGE